MVIYPMNSVRGNELAALRMANRSKIIGVMEGVFDILHIGHVVALEALRRRCDLVVILVRSDDRVKADGETSLTRQAQRVQMVSMLRGVDIAFIYGGELDKVIRELRPDVFGTAHPERYRRNYDTYLLKNFKCSFAHLTRVPRPKKKLIYET